MTRKILVTSALPYANGPIHLGHMVEYIQTDIWARFQRMQGNQCLYVCADDTHGTAIMLSAKKAGVTEQQWIDQMSESHQADFADFQVQFDQYGSTHSDENREIAADAWKKLVESDLIDKREVKQLFDPKEEVFLADRFVKGTCPHCQATDQAGDNCDKCGHTYEATDLINPVSTLSDAAPEIRSAPHFFFQLEKVRPQIESWINEGNHLQAETANYLKGHFLGDELRDWDLSRMGPYFGFEIPDNPGQYWYVWFDAPLGYIAATKQWADRNNQSIDDWWKDDQTEIHHFIGKDIVYFHTLFWPAVLDSAGYNLPKKVRVHGFLTVNGKKMAKRERTFITARNYVNNLDPGALRYFYASRLNGNQDDIDLNLNEFLEKVNTDLVGKVVNIASRTAKFASRVGLAETYPADGGLFQAAAEKSSEIASAYENCQTQKAMRLILELADAANQYIEHAQPWNLAKQDDGKQQLQNVVTVGLNLFRQITIYLGPVLPELLNKTEQLLGHSLSDWSSAQSPMTCTTINKFKHLMKRIDPKDIEKMMEENAAELAADAAASEPSPYNDSDEALNAEPLAEECTIDDFMKVDLRVARVVKAEEVPEARKLLKLTVSLGGDNTRQVFAGIKAAYSPEQLEGRLVVIVANLKPRKMRFGMSEGMVAAAGGGGAEVFVLGVDEGAVPGQRVH